MVDFFLIRSDEIKTGKICYLLFSQPQFSGRINFKLNKLYNEVFHLKM